MNKNEIMQMGIDAADKSMAKNAGGPFGAVVVKDGEIIATSSNSVLADNDPTAHAEVNAIREACRVLDTYDLSGCELYATGYPCPMCLGAIIWANIKKIYVSGLPEDANEIGFRDNYIYDFIKKGMADAEVLDIEELERQPAVDLYSKYASLEKTIY